MNGYLEDHFSRLNSPKSNHVIISGHYITNKTTAIYLIDCLIYCESLFHCYILCILFDIAFVGIFFVDNDFVDTESVGTSFDVVSLANGVDMDVDDFVFSFFGSYGDAASEVRRQDFFRYYY